MNTPPAISAFQVFALPAMVILLIATMCSYADPEPLCYDTVSRSACEVYYEQTGGPCGGYGETCPDFTWCQNIWNYEPKVHHCVQSDVGKASCTNPLYAPLCEVTLVICVRYGEDPNYWWECEPSIFQAPPCNVGQTEATGDSCP